MRATRRGAPARFRHWGLLLASSAIVLGCVRAPLSCLIVSGVWASYMLTVRLTRCRVETARGQPCRWRVRGFLGTCDYHTGDKWSVPKLYHARGRLPVLMWQRQQPANTPRRSEPQPAPHDRGCSTVAKKARRDGYDYTAIGLTIGGLIVSVIGLVHTLITGK